MPRRWEEQKIRLRLSMWRAGYHVSGVLGRQGPTRTRRDQFAAKRHRSERNHPWNHHSLDDRLFPQESIFDCLHQVFRHQEAKAVLERDPVDAPQQMCLEEILIARELTLHQARDVWLFTLRGKMVLVFHPSTITFKLIQFTGNFWLVQLCMTTWALLIINGLFR
jgi:hypothetical protein